MLVTATPAVVLGRPSGLPAEGPSKRSHAPPAGAADRPGAARALSRAEIEELRDALYELELTKGDWAKSH
jgi:hypothetical protein